MVWGFICPIKLLNWMFYLKLNFIFSFRVPQKPTQLPLIEHNRDICHWISLIHSLVPTCSAVLLTTCLGPPSLRRRRLCRKWSWRQPLPRMMIGWLSMFKVHHTQLQQTNTSAVLYVTYCMLLFILNSLNIYVFLFLWCYITLHSNHANISCYYFCLDACFTKQPHLVFRFAQQTVLDGW